MKKSLIKDLIPPFLLKSIQRSGLINSRLNWKGNYANWEEAHGNSTGYDSSEIVERVKASLLKVKNGEAAYERDSVLFDTMEYDWPTVSLLMWVAAQSGYLNVMDFGGSLGSTYFQNKLFLKDIKNFSWNIIEQTHFVECGKENFQDEQLKFYFDIEGCMKENKINLVILSSVLPYLKEPYELLKKLHSLDIDSILIDKIPLIDSTIDRLTVQHIPASIYKASYPSWFFSTTKFYEFMEKHFRIVVEFDRNIIVNIPSLFKGMLLAKKAG